MLKLSFTVLLTVFVLFVGCTEEEAIPRVAENSFELQSARAKDENRGQSQKDKKEVTGCTRTIGFWKNHLDVLTPLLPFWLGEEGGTESVEVTSAEQAHDLLDFKSDNGVLKLYAQMLATKLNILSEAPDTEVADAIIDADAFLSDNGSEAWEDLSEEDKQMVLDWKTLFDEFNNGRLDVAHCDDVDHDEDNGETEEEPIQEPVDNAGGDTGSTGGEEEEEESV